jgi:hypothetical protein
MDGDVHGPSGLHSGARMAGVVALRRRWKRALLCGLRASCCRTSAGRVERREREAGAVRARCPAPRMLVAVVIALRRV